MPKPPSGGAQATRPLGAMGTITIFYITLNTFETDWNSKTFICNNYSQTYMLLIGINKNMILLKKQFLGPVM